MFISKNNHSLATMKQFEATLLQNWKESSKESKEIGDMAWHYYFESLVETIVGEYMGSALACMKQAAKLGNDRAKFVIEQIDIQDQFPISVLHTHFVSIAQHFLNEEDDELKERYPDGMSSPEEMVKIQHMLSTGNKKDFRRLLMKELEKGSFHAYILLQGPTLKDRS